MSAETERQQVQNDVAANDRDHHNVGGIHIGGKDMTNNKKNLDTSKSANDDHHHRGGVFVGGVDKSKEYGTESKKLEEEKSSSNQGILGNAFQAVKETVGSASQPSRDHHNSGGVHVGGDNYGSISYNGKSASKTLKEKNQNKNSKKEQNKKGNTGGYHVDGDNHDDVVYNDGDDSGQQSNL